MMSDPGKVLFTLIPHCNPRGSVGFTMKLTRICLVSLGCVAGAFSFGVIANAALDIVMPAKATAVIDTTAAAPVAAIDTPAQAQVQPASFALASVESTPVVLGPAKVKTMAIVVRDGEFAEPASAPVAAAHVPLPRP